MVTTLKALKADYAKAKSAGLAEFTHDGKEFVTSYAKYFLDYMEMQRFPDTRVIQFTDAPRPEEMSA